MWTLDGVSGSLNQVSQKNDIQSPRDVNTTMKTPTYKASSGKPVEYFLKEMSFNEPNDS